MRNPFSNFIFLRKLFKRSDEKHYPPTYMLELNRQCNQVVLLGAIVSLFVWIPYIQVDGQLHPDVPSLLFFRLGMSVVALAVILLRFSDFFKKRGYFLLFFLLVYVEIATAILTALVRADTVYLSGYFLAIILLSPIPFSRNHGLSLLAVSLISFMFTGFLTGMSFETIEEKYNLNNLVAASIISGALIYLLDRIRHASYNKSMQIQKEKDKNEELLLNILPRAVAKELKEKGSVRPVLYKEATVLFLDFVGFTQTSEILSPEKLIREVDLCFKNFDLIMEKYGLEKIKTIGDSYMCAGGVPESKHTSCVDTILAAIDMKMFLKEHNKLKMAANEPFWDFRIGIHIGPLISGVVGKKKFTYDIWGDTVNIASRIESASQPGEINISSELYEKIKYFFNCEYRGKIPAKRKGEIDMYFIKGFRDGFCDTNGNPNHFFWDLYEKIEMGSSYKFIEEDQTAS